MLVVYYFFEKKIICYGLGGVLVGGFLVVGWIGV
jgi:hypothetical protein